MNVLEVVIDPQILYQRQIVNFEYEGKAKRIVFECRYLYKTEKWYISLFDAQTNLPLCTYIPVIASYTALNNLLEPFTHKRLGWMACVPAVDEPSSENPSKDNWNEFKLLWGDTFE